MYILCKDTGGASKSMQLLLDRGSTKDAAIKFMAMGVKQAKGNYWINCYTSNGLQRYKAANHMEFLPLCLNYLTNELRKEIQALTDHGIRCSGKGRYEKISFIPQERYIVQH